MRISDWSSDVCSSDLRRPPGHAGGFHTSHAEKIRPGQINAVVPALVAGTHLPRPLIESSIGSFRRSRLAGMKPPTTSPRADANGPRGQDAMGAGDRDDSSEERSVGKGGVSPFSVRGRA